MLPNFPPLPSEIVTRREGWSAAIGITIAVLACIVTGFFIGWLNG